MLFNRMVGAACAGALALIVVVPLQSARAQQAAPSAAATALAKEILDLKDGGRLYEAVVPSVVEQVRQLLLQNNPTMGKDLNEVATDVRNELAPRSKELGDIFYKLYAASFTESELKDVLAFYKSPVGRKVIVTEPKVIEEGVKAIDDWSEKLAQDVIARVRVEMRKRGHEL